jgi:hypothetical protein
MAVDLQSTEAQELPRDTIGEGTRKNRRLVIAGELLEQP